jgi:hypothetical protein
MTHRIPAAARDFYDQLDLSLRIRLTGQDVACGDVSDQHARRGGLRQLCSKTLRTGTVSDQL